MALKGDQLTGNNIQANASAYWGIMLAPTVRRPLTLTTDIAVPQPHPIPLTPFSPGQQVGLGLGLESGLGAGSG